LNVRYLAYENLAYKSSSIKSAGMRQDNMGCSRSAFKLSDWYYADFS